MLPLSSRIVAPSSGPPIAASRDDGPRPPPPRDPPGCTARSSIGDRPRRADPVRGRGAPRGAGATASSPPLCALAPPIAASSPPAMAAVTDATHAGLPTGLRATVATLSAAPLQPGPMPIPPGPLPPLQPCESRGEPPPVPACVRSIVGSPTGPTGPSPPPLASPPSPSVAAFAPVPPPASWKPPDAVCPMPGPLRAWRTHPLSPCASSPAAAAVPGTSMTAAAQLPAAMPPPGCSCGTMAASPLTDATGSRVLPLPPPPGETCPPPPPPPVPLFPPPILLRATTGVPAGAGCEAPALPRGAVRWCIACSAWLSLMHGRGCIALLVLPCGPASACGLGGQLRPGACSTGYVPLHSSGSGGTACCRLSGGGMTPCIGCGETCGCCTDGTPNGAPGAWPLCCAPLPCSGGSPSGRYIAGLLSEPCPLPTGPFECSMDAWLVVATGENAAASAALGTEPPCIRRLASPRPCTSGMCGLWPPPGMPRVPVPRGNTCCIPRAEPLRWSPARLLDSAGMPAGLPFPCGPDSPAMPRSPCGSALSAL
eukprot:363984-Chlamydomonas_euryale.AAC.30